MLECPKCGFDNELGRIFCHQCGSKLDLEKIKAPTEGAKMRRRAAVGARKTVRVGIELAIAVGLIATIWLMWLVPDVQPVKPTNAEMIGADTKRLELPQLTSGKKPGSLEITDGEVNAYLNTLGMERPKGTGFAFVPVTLRTQFSDGAVKVEFVGDVRFSDAIHKQLYLGLTGTPSVRQGRFVFTPTGGWIGKLPIHPKLVEWTGLLQSYFGKFFGKLDQEREALGKLSSLSVGPNKAVLEYQPPASK